MGRGRESERALERVVRGGLVAHEPVTHSDLAGQESEPTVVAELHGEALSLLGNRECSLELAELVDGEPELDSYIHRELERLPCVGEMGERGERVLEMGRRLAKGESCHGLGACLPTVRNGLLHELPAKRVTSEALDVL